MLQQDLENLYASVMDGEATSSISSSPEVLAERLQAAMHPSRIGVVELNELGRHLFLAGAIGHAYECYALAAQDVRALGARVNQGRCDIRLSRFEVAETRARALLAEKPRFAPAWQLLSDALLAQQRLDEAADALRKAAELAPEQGKLYQQLGEIYEQLDDVESATTAYEQAVALDRRDIRSLRGLIFCKRSICDWRDLDALSARYIASIAAGSREVSPFEFLAEGATAGQELLCAQARVERMRVVAGLNSIEMGARATSTQDRLRVGFVSRGFGLHPTAILTAAMFEHLKTSSLEVHLFSTRVDEKGRLRQRLMAAAHKFHDVPELSSRDIARRVREEGIDILVDLDGYTRSRVPEVFAYQPAPIQVSWLAYPGTTGAAFMDYVIADRFVLPESIQPYFNEKVAYLPRCYQCSDTTRIVGKPPSRESCGLPAEDAVVYACFNTHFKLNQRSFVRMMRVLAGVPGSVLWLLKGPGRADDRLREAARDQGVAPSRLIFMDKLAHVAYLTCYRHVDLFLDTEHYNAHTVASDALWAGCPVLTRPGETFATRVAGSLNHHLGMGEMNVESDEAFVALAVRYGLDEAYRAVVRERLAQQIRQSGLFDMRAYAQDFAALLVRMAGHHRAGGIPDDFPDAYEPL